MFSLQLLLLHDCIMMQDDIVYYVRCPCHAMHSPILKLEDDILVVAVLKAKITTISDLQRQLGSSSLTPG